MTERSCRLWALARMALTTVLAIPHVAVGTPVRVFAVNPRVELYYADSYTDYHDKMAALLDATHPRRAELVQSDVDDVASHIRPRDSSAPAAVLVALPEDVGLVAGLIGSRGAAARQATAAVGGSTAAFASLAIAYQPLLRYYTQRFPGLPGLRYLFLAETDTYYRAFYETFRDLAVTYGVHIAASVNVAPARRTEDPVLVQSLRDPDEPARPYAYEAIAPNVVNTLFVFAPDGEVLVRDASGNTVRSPSQTGGVLRGSLDKAYLTEIEQAPLGLAYGAVRDLGVLDTPIGRIGSVISKDAWMIDVNDRYDAKRARLILQAEAFDTWGFTLDPWAPDGFKDGGFAQVQRNPSFLFNVTPCLVGNLFEITFDGQGAIIGKRRKGVTPPLTPNTAWIGQNPDSGFVAIAPWVRDDPAVHVAGLTLAQRRAQLVAAGTPLLPLSGVACPTPNAAGACENGYRESIIFADLNLSDSVAAARTPGPPMPTSFEPSRVVAAPAGGEQRHPVIAAHGGNVYVAYQDSSHGIESVYLAVSHDGGQSFDVQRASSNVAGAVVELRPSIAVRRDGAQVFVAWQEFCSGHTDGCGRIKLARFDAAGHKLGADIRVDRGADDTGKWNPAVAVDPHGRPLVAWVDERDSGPRGIPFEHIYFSRSVDLVGSMGPTVRVDSGAPVPASSSLDNKWAPSVIASNNWIHVLWTDFRNYNWDIYSARSRNGTRFRPNLRVDDAVGLERIDDHPVPAIDGSGRLHVVWADRRAQEPVTTIRHARSDNRGRSFGASAPVDVAATQFDPDTETPNNQWSPSIAASGNDVFVVWQDNRLGDNDIFFARSRDGEVFEVAERVDDSGDDPSNQYRPAIAVGESAPAGRTIYVAWEDERYGPATIAVTRRVLP